jgi:hypothetical protein
VSIGGGAGVADPFHADFDFTAPTWQASVHGHLRRHLGIEGFASGWWHTSSSESLDVLIEAPSGPLGRVERIAQETKRTVRVIGINVLGRSSSGRLSFYGGGGPGLWLHNRRFTQTTSGCEDPVAHLCGTHQNNFNSSSLSVQGVAGVDAAVTSRLIAFGQYQAVFPVSDPGIGHAAVTAGIRFALK